jgi:hypothetical protein
MVDDIAGLRDEVGDAPGCENAMVDDLAWGLGMIGCRTRRRAQRGQAALGTPRNPLKALSGNGPSCDAPLSTAQLAIEGFLMHGVGVHRYESRRYISSSVSLRWSTEVSTSSNSRWLTPAKTV